MKLVRTFHPVGHGAFYTERFYEDNNPQPIFTAVFDCGCFERGKLGMSPKKFQQRIERYVNSIFQSQETIDVLFISHFHTDHINGVEHLLTRCNVKKIFIPVMTPEVVLEAYLHSMVQLGRRSNVVSHFIEEIFNNEELKEKIVQINDEFQEEERQLNNAVGTLPSGVTLSGCHSWYYLPFNIKQNFLPQLIAQEPLLQNAIKPNGEVDFTKLTGIVKSRTIKHWERVYNGVWPSKHNAYSMTIYSTNLSNNPIPVSWNGAILGNIAYLQNCLYTGDYEAKVKANFNALQSRYNKYWQNIYIMQVPHHGSKDNYNASLYNKPIFCIISAGATDIYRHPSHRTIIGIQQNRCLPIVVTEDKYTCQTISYVL